MHDDLIAYAAAMYVEKNSPTKGKISWVSITLAFLLAVAQFVVVYLAFNLKR